MAYITSTSVHGVDLCVVGHRSQVVSRVGAGVADVFEVVYLTCSAYHIYDNQPGLLKLLLLNGSGQREQLKPSV